MCRNSRSFILRFSRGDFDVSGFLKRAGLFALLQVIILGVVLQYGSERANNNQYMYVLKDKYERLKRATGPRAIFVGGSNLAFGIQSHTVEERLGLNPINLGVHGSLGLKPLLAMIREEVRHGDLIILSPERVSLFNDIDCLPDLAIEAVSAWPEGVRFIQPACDQSLKEHLPRTTALRRIGNCVANSVHRLKRGIPGPSIYTRRGFNEFGDHVAHYGQSSERTLLDRVCEVRPDQVAEITRELNLFHQHCESVGANVVFVHPPVTERLNQVCAAQLEQMDRLLQSKLSIPMLTRWDSLVLEDAMFYDSFYHLNEQGAEIRTDALCQLIEDSRGNRMVEIPVETRLR